MAKQILDEIDLFPMQQQLLDLITEASAESVPTEPISATEDLFYSGLMSEEQFVSAQSDNLIEQMLELQPVTDEMELMDYTSDEIIDTGLIYAPYIPLYVNPSVNVSDLKKIRFRSLTPTRYKIPKYNDIYSDIKERFELLDL